ncbi:hypothetical protein BpHYR1_002999 [Brachionus plicatilis]|uniref:RNA-directed DNA polymerase from mobile element jockey-like n=1 Tax=Brachionus plicatilis TaxID=10195 RepID=A0A3M7RIY3_BRAPC|nr:hypothetical protein BpHYR1_002999 [Brachionus plicatilis]
MTSDHFPIEASISMGYQLENKSAAKNIPYHSQKIYKTCLPPNIVNLIKEPRKEFKINEEKGKCFGELLSSIFSPNTDLIDTEKDIEILNSNSDFFRNNNHLESAFELSERYVGKGLSHSIPLVVRLVNKYKEGFESIYFEYPTPLLISNNFVVVRKQQRISIKVLPDTTKNL